jgi:hypothetical protein
MSENVISIELLKTAFSSEHYPALFRGKQTHDAGLRFVAQLMPHTTDVDWITISRRVPCPTVMTVTSSKRSRPWSRAP